MDVCHDRRTNLYKAGWWVSMGYHLGVLWPVILIFPSALDVIMAGRRV